MSRPVVADRTLARTGFDPGLLLMLGGALIVAGILIVRYAETDVAPES